MYKTIGYIVGKERGDKGKFLVPTNQAEKDLLVRRVLSGKIKRPGGKDPKGGRL